MQADLNSLIRSITGIWTARMVKPPYPFATDVIGRFGIAGTMAANHTGLQWGTVRNLCMAWVLTLPVSMMLAGFLFWGFRNIF
jgi:phosphate/sulfate permease